MAQYTSNWTERHHNADFHTQGLTIKDEQGRALRALQRSLADRIERHGRKDQPRQSA